MTPAELRQSRGKRTQVQLAQLMGVSAPSLRNWEQGVSPIPAYVDRLMAFLGPATAPVWHWAVVDTLGLKVTRDPTPFASAYDAKLALSQLYDGNRAIADQESRTVFVVL